MPDHVHLLFTLGKSLSVGQVMGKFKTLARRAAEAAWTWQLNGFEHRLRPEEQEAHYAFYLFMNPYRAGCITLEQTWPGWICEEPERYRFLSGLSSDGTPPAEWLTRAEALARHLPV